MGQLWMSWPETSSTETMFGTRVEERLRVADSGLYNRGPSWLACHRIAESSVDVEPGEGSTSELGVHPVAGSAIRGSREFVLGGTNTEVEVVIEVRISATYCSCLRPPTHDTQPSPLDVMTALSDTFRIDCARCTSEELTANPQCQTGTSLRRTTENRPSPRDSNARAS